MDQCFLQEVEVINYVVQGSENEKFMSQGGGVSNLFLNRGCKTIE